MTAQPAMSRPAAGDVTSEQSERVTVRYGATLLEAVRAEAVDRGLTLAECIRILLAERLELPPRAADVQVVGRRRS